MRWKKIPKSDIYFASDCGQIGSLYIKGTRSKTDDTIKILKNSTCRRGYALVHLYENGKRKTCQVHRLVMMTFVGESKLHVNHKNGIKKDNSLENLEYVTPSQNMRHAYDTGLSKKPPNMAKLTIEQVRYIIETKGVVGCYKLGRELGIDPSQVTRIRNGKHLKRFNGII